MDYVPGDSAATKNDSVSRQFDREKQSKKFSLFKIVHLFLINRGWGLNYVDNCLNSPTSLCLEILTLRGYFEDK
jgi:hypothetical protein